MPCSSSHSLATAAVLLAGGSGNRMEGAVADKVLETLAGKPVIRHSIDAFIASGEIETLVIVYRDEVQQRAIEATLPPEGPRLLWARGGKERQDSVRSGLSALPDDTEVVLIHDCARPLVSPKAIRASIAAVRQGSAACLARPVTDTLKEVESRPAGYLPRSLDRSKLWAMETPQSFPFPLIREAYEKVIAEKRVITDDLSAIEEQMIPVAFIDNEGPNPKLTTAQDLAYVAYLLAQTQATAPRPTVTSPLPNIRIGQGYDIHSFKEGRPMVLGGVTFDTPYGLDGHSDADVLTHAICDALLGAAGLPDIGHYFPNTDPKYKDIDSQELLREVAAAIRDKGYAIGNIDASLIAEKPKIAPKLEAMKTALARSAGIDPEQIGIKATTNESLGSLGRGEGAAAHATCLLFKAK